MTTPREQLVAARCREIAKAPSQHPAIEIKDALNQAAEVIDAKEEPERCAWSIVFDYATSAWLNLIEGVGYALQDNKLNLTDDERNEMGEMLTFLGDRIHHQGL